MSSQILTFLPYYDKMEDGRGKAFPARPARVLGSGLLGGGSLPLFIYVLETFHDFGIV